MKNILNYDEFSKNKNQIDDKKSKGIYANFKNYNVNIFILNKVYRLNIIN